MGQTWGHTLTDARRGKKYVINYWVHVQTNMQEKKMFSRALLPLGFTIIARCVIGQTVKNKYLSPFCTLI